MTYLSDLLALAEREDDRISLEREHAAQHERERENEQFRKAYEWTVELMPELLDFVGSQPSEDDCRGHRTPAIIWRGSFGEGAPDIKFGTRRSGHALAFYVPDYRWSEWASFSYAGNSDYVEAGAGPDERRLILALVVRASVELELAEKDRRLSADAEQPAEEPAQPAHYHDWRARLARVCTACMAIVLEPVIVEVE